eukprot:353551-Prymnesium_polylepis.1
MIPDRRIKDNGTVGSGQSQSDGCPWGLTQFALWYGRPGCCLDLELNQGAAIASCDRAALATLTLL